MNKHRRPDRADRNAILALETFEDRCVLSGLGLLPVGSLLTNTTDAAGSAVSALVGAATGSSAGATATNAAAVFQVNDTSCSRGISRSVKPNFV